MVAKTVSVFFVVARSQRADKVDCLTPSLLDWIDEGKQFNFLFCQTQSLMLPLLTWTGANCESCCIWQSRESQILRSKFSLSVSVTVKEAAPMSSRRSFVERLHPHCGTITLRFLKIKTVCSLNTNPKLWKSLQIATCDLWHRLSTNVQFFAHLAWWWTWTGPTMSHWCLLSHQCAVD